MKAIKTRLLRIPKSVNWKAISSLEQSLRTWLSWADINAETATEADIFRLVHRQAMASQRRGGLSGEKVYVDNLYEVHMVVQRGERRTLWRKRLPRTALEERLGRVMDQNGWETEFELACRWCFEDSSDDITVWIVSRTQPTRIPTQVVPVGSLIRVDADGTETAYPITDTTALGSFQSVDEGPNDIRIGGDPKVSDVHARIRVQGENALVSDAGSKNGTQLANRLLGHGEEAVLQVGGWLQIGDTLFRFDRPTPFRPRLRIIRGPTASLTLPPYEIPSSGPQITVGKGESKSGKFCLPPDDAAEFEHAFVRVTSGRTELQDNNSTNGTLVNGSALEPGMWTVLQPGDIIRLGNIELRYQDN